MKTCISLLLFVIAIEAGTQQMNAAVGSSVILPLHNVKGFYVRTLQNGKRYRLTCNRQKHCGWRIDNIDNAHAQFTSNYERVLGGLKINNVQKHDAGLYDVSLSKEPNPNKIYLTIN